ncbi:MAG TPA: imidazoleglycerol-phosphate dehydratase [Gemmatimonadaceae bacterium]|nr:imidazoleglycerol-phosphate dehydratase [Gemmatimonadaceae bacterium]
MSEIVRETRETRVRVAFARAGGESRISTAIPFLDHMLATLARYAGASLQVSADGDLRHHIAEDVAITVGTAVLRATPNACARYGHRVVPMDDALVEVTLDLGGRVYYRGPLPSAMYDHWMRSFAQHAQCTLHVRVLRGRDRHHIVEAAFKALGMALREALTEQSAEMSTKGPVRLEDVCLPGD